MIPKPFAIDHEKLLYKLVIQFLIFCQGSHKLLEPHLLQISKRLKAGANLAELTPELMAVSKTLLHISRQTEPASGAQDHELSSRYLLERVEELITHSAVPLRYRQHSANLRQIIRQDQTGQSLHQVLDSAITLLMDSHQYSVAEQREIDSFLTELSDQLNQIEQHAEVVDAASRQALAQSQQIDQALNDQFPLDQDEQNAASHALPREQLVCLLWQLIKHKQSEDLRQAEAQQQIVQMTVKLKALEVETESLRNKLKIEHDRALSDPLTGLPNRLAYKERVEMEANRWQRYRSSLSLSLAVWDIDFFKRINDNYGHKAGDKTLALVGQLLANNCRSTDFVARYGGEEFVMLMPNTPASGALTMAEHLRDMIQRCGFNYNGVKIDLPLSCGISEFFGEDRHEDVFERADQALYQAKQSGRNRCLIFDTAVSFNGG